jgi:hypothetical protein
MTAVPTSAVMTTINTFKPKARILEVFQSWAIDQKRRFQESTPAPPAEGDAHPRIGALQGLFRGSGYPYKRSHLVPQRPTKISALDPPSTWWPGER